MNEKLNLLDYVTLRNQCIATIEEYRTKHRAFLAYEAFLETAVTLPRVDRRVMALMEECLLNHGFAKSDFLVGYEKAPTYGSGGDKYTVKVRWRDLSVQPRGTWLLSSDDLTFERGMDQKDIDFQLRAYASFAEHAAFLENSLHGLQARVNEYNEAVQTLAGLARLTVCLTGKPPTAYPVYPLSSAFHYYDLPVHST